VLRQLPARSHPNVIVGTETSDDAGVFRLNDDLAIVNTVDFFTPIVDDPYVFGQIAAANALSDVYAMGADPLTALNIVGFPKGQMEMEVLADVIRGGLERAAAADTVVIGGHTIIDPELKYGMAVTGVVHPDKVIRNSGARAGDVLVLTKPLGTGIVTTALKQRKASRGHVRAAVQSMVTLNRAASSAMRAFSVHACSDVTGFGLLGHATEMAMASGVTLVLEADRLPLLPGARQLAEQGFLTGGCRRNRDYLQDKVVVEGHVGGALEEIAFDPQTSGGLLIAVPARSAERLVRRLRAKKVVSAAIVGRAVRQRAAWVYLS
jgi:selenide, water dikinase